MLHILETIMIPATGVTVESVQFSREVRLVVCHTAKAFLSELNLNESDFYNKYRQIKNVYDFFNSYDKIYAKWIRNAIRVLDMRITHCNNSLKEGEWIDTDRTHGFFVSDITEKTGTTYVKKSDDIIPEHYVGTTMELMLATRQILVDSLITVSGDFE